MVVVVSKSHFQLSSREREREREFEGRCRRERAQFEAVLICERLAHSVTANLLQVSWLLSSFCLIVDL